MLPNTFALKGRYGLSPAVCAGLSSRARPVQVSAGGVQVIDRFGSMGTPVVSYTGLDTLGSNRSAHCRVFAGNWTTLLAGTIMVMPFMVSVPPPSLPRVAVWMYPACPNPAGTLLLSTVKNCALASVAQSKPIAKTKTIVSFNLGFIVLSPLCTRNQCKFATRVYRIIVRADQGSRTSAVAWPDLPCPRRGR